LSPRAESRELLILTLNKKILIIGFVWPEPNSSAAGSRMMQLIEAFQSKNYQITFASAAGESTHAVDLKSLDIEVKNIQLNHSSFDEFVKNLQPNVVMFDRFTTEEQFSWRIAEQCPEALRLLDTEDLHSLRKTRQECFKKGEEFTIAKWLQADITKREIASIYRCDLSLIISAYEMQLLQETIKIDGSLLYYLPFMLDGISKSDIEKLPAFAERQDFVTIGNFRHEPNYDAVVYLKKTIWPLIKAKLPKAEMHVYGSYPMQKVEQLYDEEQGFLIKGWADNANVVMQNASVCLAPLRFGAGLKGKFITAMQNGTPSITTSVGAEGLEDNFGGFIENVPQTIADKAIELYTNKDVWQLKQNDGFKLLWQFNKQQLQKQLLNNLEQATQQLHEKRLRNFTGAMLQHQTIQSSKYMSKWIEEKNS